MKEITICDTLLLVVDELYINLNLYASFNDIKINDADSKYYNTIKFFSPNIKNSLYYKKDYWVTYEYAFKYLNGKIESYVDLKNIYTKNKKIRNDYFDKIEIEFYNLNSTDQLLYDQYYDLLRDNISVLLEHKYYKTYILFTNLQKIKGSLFKKFSMYYKFIRGLDDVNEIAFFTNSYSSFENKYSKFLKDGILTFVHKNIGNRNAAKDLTQEEKQFVLNEYQSGTKISMRQITKKINQSRIYNGKEVISNNSISRLIHKDSNYLDLYINRYGKESTEEMLLHPKRIQPKNPGSVFQMDGTRLNIIGLDSNNKPTFYNILVILDVYSKCILEFRLVEREHFTTYREMLTDIILRTEHVPSEIVTDNLQSFKSENAVNYFSLLKYFDCFVRHHTKLCPQDKGQVENWFNIFGNQYLKEIPGYLGDGIKSKIKDGKPTLDLIKKYRKRASFYTLSELNDIITERIKNYNNSYSFKNSKPQKLFHDTKFKGRKIINFDKILLSYDSKSIVLKKAFVNIQINNELCEYPIFKDNLHFFEKNFNKSIKVFFNKSDTDHIYLASFNNFVVVDSIILNKHMNFPLAQVDQLPEDIVNMNKFCSQRNHFKASLQSKIKADNKVENNPPKKTKKIKIKDIEILPIDLIDERIDNKELVISSLVNEADVNKGDIKISLESLYKIQGTNKLIN